MMSPYCLRGYQPALDNIAVPLVRSLADELIDRFHAGITVGPDHSESPLKPSFLRRRLVLGSAIGVRQKPVSDILIDRNCNIFSRSASLIQMRK